MINFFKKGYIIKKIEEDFANELDFYNFNK